LHRVFPTVAVSIEVVQRTVGAALPELVAVLGVIVNLESSQKSN